MRHKILGLCLALLPVLLLGLPATGSQAAEPEQGGLNAFPAPPAGPNVQAAAQAAAQADKEKPGAVETLKKALEAQGEVSPQTMEALKGSPVNPDPARADGKAQGSGQSGKGGQSGKKAIYGDIIIHK